MNSRQGGGPAAPHGTATVHSVSKNDTPHNAPLRSRGAVVGYLLVILSHTRNIFKWGGSGE